MTLTSEPFSCTYNRGLVNFTIIGLIYAMMEEFINSNTIVLPMLASAVIGYLLGSIPFGLILTKLGGYGDIRDIGSGNIGATNVLRTGNKKLAIATLVLDALKGAAAILIIWNLFSNVTLFDCATPDNCGYTIIGLQLFILTAALFALLGHIFPVWLKFKGGKGVATGLGILLTLAWPVGAAAALTWLVTALITRISSLSALVAVSLSPAFAYGITFDPRLTILCALMAIIIVSKHHANIKRLLKGEEPKIGKKKTE